MNARHKKFILNKLIPFILREQGRGFGMDSWVLRGTSGEEYWMDDVERKMPVCGTMCCIGGSVQVLKGHRKNVSTSRIAKYLGITPNAANGLFNDWFGEGSIEEDGHKYGWPLKFADKYDEATTPYRKAKVAVSLLKEVVKTNGECLRLD